LETDAILVERCLAGDQAAWADLVKAHTRRIYNLCYRFTGRSEEAQDLTQDVFLRVFRSLGSFEGSQGSFTTWLTSLTRNLLIDHYRKFKKERLVDSLDDQIDVLEEKGTVAGSPEMIYRGRESDEMLQGAMNRLSPDLREAVILRDLQELEYREISQILKVPEGTVKSRINRGRASLGQILRRTARTTGS
jgi:RNA polymerase sigma-70 factor (ECF subfamily)